MLLANLRSNCLEIHFDPFAGENAPCSSMTGNTEWIEANIRPDTTPCEVDRSI